jgi:hypothetical protein
MYSSAVKQGSNLVVRDLLEPILRRFGVQLVLSGHDHSYVSALSRPLLPSRSPL